MKNNAAADRHTVQVNLVTMESDSIGCLHRAFFHVSKKNLYIEGHSTTRFTAGQWQKGPPPAVEMERDEQKNNRTVSNPVEYCSGDRISTHLFYLITHRSIVPSEIGLCLVWGPPKTSFFVRFRNYIQPKTDCNSFCVCEWVCVCVHHRITWRDDRGWPHQSSTVDTTAVPPTAGRVYWVLFYWVTPVPEMFFSGLEPHHTPVNICWTGNRIWPLDFARNEPEFVFVAEF